METTTYPAPVNKLLTWGPITNVPVEKWPDYLALGIGPEHIPDLIRMAKDHSLRIEFFDEEAYPDFNEDEHPEFWAPIHALRTLGELHASSASEALLLLFDESIKLDDEWMSEDLPKVYGMFDPGAIPPLATFIADTSHDEYARIYATDCLYNIDLQHPEARDECVQVLIKQLEKYEENTYDLNGFLVLRLVKFEAREALPIIEQAFAADRVDEFIMGDWDDVQVEFGLKSREEVEEKRRIEQEKTIPPRIPFTSQDNKVSHLDVKPSYFSTPISAGKRADKKRAKEKTAKASRKKNKRKK